MCWQMRLRVPELGPGKRKGDHEVETTGWMPRTIPGLSSSSPMVGGGLLGQLLPPPPQHPQFQI